MTKSPLSVFGWSLYALACLGAALATPTVWHRAREASDYGGMASVWGPLVVVALVSVALKHDARRAPAEVPSPSTPRQTLVVGLLAFFGLAFYLGLLGGALGLEAHVRRWTILLGAIWFAIGLALPQPTEFPAAERPTFRWILAHWRAAYLCLCALAIAVAALARDATESLWLLSVVGLVLPGTWTRTSTRPPTDEPDQKAD